MLGTSETTYLYKKAFQVSRIYFVRNILVPNSLVPKYLGTLRKTKLPLFDNTLMTLEFLHQTMLSFKGMLRCIHEKLFGKLIDRRPWLSPISRSETLLNIFSVTDVTLQIF